MSAIDYLSDLSEFIREDTSSEKSFSSLFGDILGDMFYIKHYSQNFTVIDCFLKDGQRKDEIIDEIVQESADRICRFISTHPDNDHIAGLECLNKQWEILNFYAVKNNYPIDKSDASLDCYHKLLSEKNFPVKRRIKRSWLNQGDMYRGSSGIEFLWPDVGNEKFKQALKDVANGENVNNICPIFTYREKNSATYMWMGDLETDMQQEYYENEEKIPKVDILFQPHHGRKSGAPPNVLLKELDPQLIIIGNAPSEYLEYGDPSKTITQYSSGDICFKNEGNFVHVFTKKVISNKPCCLKQYSNIQSPDYNCPYYVGSLTARE